MILLFEIFGVLEDLFCIVVEMMCVVRECCVWLQCIIYCDFVLYLIEELYEVIDVVEIGMCDDFCEELGDLFWQVLFYVVIVVQDIDDLFDIDDVVCILIEKMVCWYLYVFVGEVVEMLEEVLVYWNVVKVVEKCMCISVFDGVLLGMLVFVCVQKFIGCVVGVGVMVVFVSIVVVFVFEVEFGDVLFFFVVIVCVEGWDVECVLCEWFCVFEDDVWVVEIVF